MRLAALLAGAALARAGYVTVGMSEARECNTSIVEWYGDDGPYHLLLTPTKFVSHGYNVWVPSIPNGTTSYNLTINQPAGMQYMVTVWGASGIEYAGTTDVLTVQPSVNKNTSCFMSDADIHGLYSFAFNMTNSYGGDNHSPPQCSNLSVSWPTSLESPIVDEWSEVKRDAQVYTAALPPIMPHARSIADRAPQVIGTGADGDTSSSNKTSGNTTVPPTMFGIIPLGNSFSIPITYPRDSRFANDLPAESLSDKPTTWTGKGVTHMNFTVNLAKGTRFIIVAGIGSQEEWASGGSSEMLTVGQGSFDCLNHVDGSLPIPTVTASSSTSGRLSRPTVSGTRSGTDSGVATNSGTKTSHPSWVGVILACIFSVIGALLLFLLLFCCCRVRRKRRNARQAGAPAPGILSVATYGRLGQHPPASVKRFDEHGEYGNDLRLDLIGARDRDDASDSPSSRDGQGPLSRPGTDYVTESPTYRDSPLRASGYSNASFTSRSPTAEDHPFPFGTAIPHTASPVASPGPEDSIYSGGLTASRQPTSDSMGRKASLDGLLTGQSTMDSMAAYPSLAGQARSPPAQTSAPHRPLQLHDPGQLENARSSEDITDLKRETIALLQRPDGPPSPRPGPARRRRTEDTYVVHQDGGRVAVGPAPSGRVLELPPRYEELNWDNPDTDSALPPRSRTYDGASIPLPPSPVVTSTSYSASPADTMVPTMPPAEPWASSGDVTSRAASIVPPSMRAPSTVPSIIPPSHRSPSTAPSIPPGAEEPHPPGTRDRDRKR